MRRSSARIFHTNTRTLASGISIRPLSGQRWEVCIKQRTIQPRAGRELTTAAANACLSISSLDPNPGDEYLKEKIPMAEEKILTKHPLGKSGKNISKQKYDTLKGAILSALKNKELTHTELFDHLNKSLKGRCQGNVSWYGETVKLDLEARKIIERTSSKPQKYRLKST
jgi:hypothetical protein